MEVSQGNDGLNDESLKIREGGLNIEFTSLILNYSKGCSGEKSRIVDTCRTVVYVSEK